MRARYLRWVVIFIAAILLSAAQKYGWFNSPQTLGISKPGEYRVIEVHDGDTIAVDMNGKTEKVRLIGVDTPETHDPRKAVQCFGQASTDFTKSLIGKQPVRLEADRLSTNRDRYNRLLRYVYVGDRLLNLEIIAGGYGFAYLSFPFEKSAEFKSAEEAAKSSNRGLWASCPVKVDARGFISSGE